MFEISEIELKTSIRSVEFRIRHLQSFLERCDRVGDQLHRRQQAEITLVKLQAVKASLLDTLKSQAA